MEVLECYSRSSAYGGFCHAFEAAVVWGGYCIALEEVPEGSKQWFYAVTVLPGR